MPYPRKPPALKAISGSREPSPVVVPLPVIASPPPAPEWLTGAAVDEWNRLTRILTAHQLLTEGGVGALAVLCALYGDIQQQYINGESPTAKAIGQFRGLVNDFGLTPIAQGKVKPAAGGDAAGNRFAKFGQRPA